MLNQIICLFFPSIIALYINEQTDVYKGIRFYLTHVMFINLACYIVTIFGFNQPYIEFTYMFSIKYLIMSIAFTIVFAEFRKKYLKDFNVIIKVEGNERKEQKDKQL